MQDDIKLKRTPIALLPVDHEDVEDDVDEVAEVTQHQPHPPPGVGTIEI